MHEFVRCGNGSLTTQVQSLVESLHQVFWQRTPVTVSVSEEVTA